jgi:murein DD-endopeptidase MepM/ murein hydrolase activator NlpD
MKKFLLLIAIASATVFAFLDSPRGPFAGPARPDVKAPETEGRTAPSEEPLREIRGTVERGETFSHVFKNHGLNLADLSLIQGASAKTYNIGRLKPGHPYRIRLDGENRVRMLEYHIDDDSLLRAHREEGGFRSERAPIPYETRVRLTGGVIENSLAASAKDPFLAVMLSDILAWDIDFATDLRNGDTFKLVVEELWLEGRFKRYGEVLAAEFANNGRVYHAYRFDSGGTPEYFDREGTPVKRAFLKAPLSYRRISSGYSHRRLHPVLRTYQAHLGGDYAAPSGTPVSAVGDGTVHFAGYKGANGKLVILRHPNGYRTYYGHLSRIAKGVRKGRKVAQGQVIGAVGRTGRATGPHLDYRVKRRGKFLDPARLNIPRGEPLSNDEMAAFSAVRGGMDMLLDAIAPNTVQHVLRGKAHAYPKANLQAFQGGLRGDEETNRAD